MAIELTTATHRYARSAFFASSDDFTLMGWACAITLGNAYQVALSAISGLAIQVHQPGATPFWSIGTSSPDYDSALTVVAGTWYHVALVRNGTTKTLYVDGVQQATGTGSETPGPDLLIGAFDETSTGNFYGRLAAVKVWKAVLTLAEIQQESRQVMPVRTATLAAWYPLLSPSAGEIDYSGNAKTLTVTGTPITASGPPVTWRQARRVFQAAGQASDPALLLQIDTDCMSAGRY